MANNAESLKNLPVICLLAFAVGIVAGLGAWLFRCLIGVIHNLLFLGKFEWFYDANVHTPASPWGWWIILVPVVGAVVVTWLTKTFAPEAKGHGVPEVMDAIYYNDGKIRPVVAVIKSIASAVCIGSGGSVGREGPIIQIGSSFGSTLGQLISLPARQRITLISAGAAGGIAATFNAPLGGLAFGIELLLVSINAKNILPVVIATATATHVGRLLLGMEPSFYFSVLTRLSFQPHSLWGLFLTIPFGLVMGLVSAGFVRGIYWAEDRFDAMPGNEYTRHMSGMLITGIMIWLVMRFTGHYYIQGVGYAAIMDILKSVLTNPWLLLLLFGLKFAATCLTLGSGGSGGVFSPCLFMGATMGAFFGQMMAFLTPNAGVDPVVFSIAGMAAAVSASTGAILTGTVMLLEMTQDPNVVMPIMITSAVAYGFRKWLSPESIYTLKLIRRGHFVPEGLQSAMAEARQVKDITEKDFRTLDAEDPVTVSEQPTLVLKEKAVLGVLPPHVSGPAAGALVSESFLMVPGENSLDDLLREMDRVGVRFALVTSAMEEEHPHHITGMLTEKELAACARKEARLR